MEYFKTNFILTGATGWVGRNFLHELQKIIPMDIFNEKVFAFGSKSGQIYSTAYKKEIFIPIYPLSEAKNIISKNKNFFTIHTAFLTREKIINYGLEKYIEINKNILSQTEHILEECDPKKSVLISSGAAEYIEKNANNIQLEKDPYGFLKYEEEQNFKRLSNVLIMRIYGLTGKFIRDPNIFAFGNFLLSANRKEAIVIKSNRDVVRSYGSASDIAKVAIQWLLSEDNNSTELINASTHTIHLLDLAKLITDIYNLPEVLYDIDNTLKKDSYICENSRFRNFLKSFNIEQSTMKDQIIETYNYLKNDSFN